MSEQGIFKRLVVCAACGGTFAVVGYSAYEGEILERHVCKDMIVDIACMPLNDLPGHPIPQRPGGVQIVVQSTATSSANVANMDAFFTNFRSRSS